MRRVVAFALLISLGAMPTCEAIPQERPAITQEVQQADFSVLGVVTAIRTFWRNFQEWLAASQRSVECFREVIPRIRSPGRDLRRLTVCGAHR